MKKLRLIAVIIILAGAFAVVEGVYLARRATLPAPAVSTAPASPAPAPAPTQ